MRITEEEVRYIAGLAQLELSGEEVKRMTHELDAILAHMDRLRELDTEHVEPMAQVLFPGSGNATLREDEPHTPLSHEDALANAPLAGAGQFKVPRVIER